MIRSLAFLVLLAPLSLHAQNLIPNPGFENYITAPRDEGDFNLRDWFNPNPTGGSWPQSTPAHLHKNGTGKGNWSVDHFGPKIRPYKGDGLILLVVRNNSKDNFREYASVKLTSPLVVGQKYKLTFQASLGEGRMYGCKRVDGWRAGFTVDKPRQYDAEVIGDATWQYVTLAEGDGRMGQTRWTEYTFEFTATKPSGYMTIGSFLSDAGQDWKDYTSDCKYNDIALLLFDEVYLVPIGSVEAKVDLNGNK